MSEIHEIIAERIKHARESAGKTQKEIALVLNYKTPNAISEIERGNVNVSAKDLFILAAYFNKPILYFYGRDFDDDEVIAIIESLTDNEIAEIKKMAADFVTLRQTVASLQANPEQEPTREVIEKTWEVLNHQLLLLANQLAIGVKGRDQLEELLMIRPTSNKIPD